MTEIADSATPQEGDVTERERKPGSPVTSKAVGRRRSPSEEGEERDDDPPLPEEAPPLPTEAPPFDGWEPRWDASHNAFYFFNHFTGVSQWENPRLPPSIPPVDHASPTLDYGQPEDATPSATAAVADAPSFKAPYLGYNPAIHGDYDPNADYAKYHEAQVEEAATADSAAESMIGSYGQTAAFNRFTGTFQAADKSEHHNDSNKSKRQMEAFFDVDRAANAHDGKSLKAMRSNRKPSKQEVKEYNDKRRERKEKKRRDFLLS